jgi:hypothetical protein
VPVDSGTTPAPEDWQEPEFHGESLDSVGLLRRLSLDLRGSLPTAAEIEAVQADPGSIDGLIEEFMSDPRYVDRLVDLWSEQWLTRVDGFNVSYADYHLDEDRAFEFIRSVGEEPLRMMAYVGTQDLPWTEVVMADHTMANELLLEIWPLESLEDRSGWRPARYTDGRPAGGVVMSNGLWWRYYTTPNNYNRSRAAALSRLFLCEDYLLRPIKFSAPALLDRESLNAATREVATCAGCHNTLDPLAANLFGFWWYDIYDTAEMTSYHPEREQLGADYLERDPAWYGIPMEGPVELGPYIAADDRFTRCTVERMAEALWRRSPDLDDFFTLDRLHLDFEDADWRLDGLVHAILDGADYRAGALQESAPEEAESRLTTLRIMSVEQLEQVVEDLTGFVWTYEGMEELANDQTGYRILGGGIDGHQVTQPAREPSLASSLLLKRIAQAGAAWVVQKDLVEGGESRLFQYVSLGSDTPGQPDFTAELHQLHLRLHGAEASTDQLARDEALWTEVEAISDPATAWASLISVMIRDPAFWSY